MNYENLKSYEGETAVIGAALIRGAEIFDDPSIARLLASHFTDDRTIDTWTEILRQKKQFDQITIAARIQSISAHADAHWLSECILHCGNAYFAAQYANTVWHLARKRRVYHLISELGSSLFRPDFEKVLGESIGLLQRVGDAK